MIKFFKRVLFSRSFMTILLMLLQIAFYIGVYNYLYEYASIVHLIAFGLSIILSSYIFGLKGGTIDVKLPWVLLILAFPVFGSLFYFLFREQRVRMKVIRNTEKQAFSTNKISHNSKEVFEELKLSDRSVYNEAKYIFNTTNMPIYKNTITRYFPSGEKYYMALLEELKKAKNFIFIEYFIISQGKMWNSILNILKEKASQGVDIRIIYDDLGCINTLPSNYKKRIEKFGIKCEVFNPIYPIVTLAHNNRDHRKMLIIDGIVAFTGGVNLADEYINEVIRFGHWKDTGIMLEGDAVESFTLMFLETWHIYRDANEDISKLIPNLKTLPITTEYIKTRFRKKKIKVIGFDEQKLKEDFANDKELIGLIRSSNEFVQPYMSTPMETEEIVARNVYVNILNCADYYVYITTPYLILDPELEEAIINCAKRSVDVRIIVPGIPDKKYVYGVTRSQYTSLLKAGVKIYEYEPGFIHAKNVVSDDKVATVGSINFDNRSFYHSYENGVFIYNSPTVKQIKEDFIKTMNVSIAIATDYMSRISTLKRIKISLFKLLSPLL